MGLDMYLYAERYIWSDEKQRSKEILDALDIDEEMVSGRGNIYVRVEVGYWRKANAIHNWFVEQVANGVDNCEENRVSLWQLKRLRDTCKTVLAARVNQGEPVTEGVSQEPKLLPVAEGFFFGSYKYDEYYYQSLENTVEIVDNCLALNECKTHRGLEFIYRASW